MKTPFSYLEYGKPRCFTVSSCKVITEIGGPKLLFFDSLAGVHTRGSRRHVIKLRILLLTRLLI